MGEGAASLILERTRARAGTRREIYAEVLGYSLNNDAFSHDNAVAERAIRAFARCAMRWPTRKFNPNKSIT